MKAKFLVANKELTWCINRKSTQVTTYKSSKFYMALNILFMYQKNYSHEYSLDYN